MEKPVSIICVLCFALTLLMAIAVPASAQTQMVRAKIGVLSKSGDQTARTKGKDRLKAGDLLRIYVQPEESSYIYVVHSDRKNAKLLSKVDRQPKGSLLVLPSPQDFFEVDGKSPVEIFTIICSPNELKEVSALFNAPVSFEKWASVAKQLMKKGEIDLTQRSEKPFPIAGNVRGEMMPGQHDRFQEDLPIFSGNTILVKQYEFSIKR